MTINARTQEVHIYQGDDLAKIGQLRQAYDAAKRRYEQAKEAGTLRGGDSEVKTTKDAHDEFVREAAERAETVVLRALGRKQWAALLDEHRPRYERRLIDGHEQELLHPDDADWGVNIKTFPEVLLTYVNPNRAEMRTITAPDFPTAEDRLAWLDDLSGGDFLRLWATAYHLNGEPGSDPKATLLGATPSSDAT